MCISDPQLGRMQVALKPYRLVALLLSYRRVGAQTCVVPRLNTHSQTYALDFSTIYRKTDVVSGKQRDDVGTACENNSGNIAEQTE